MSTNSLQTLILTVTAVIGLGSITLATSALDRLAVRTTSAHSLSDPDRVSETIPRYLGREARWVPNDIWNMEFD